MFQDTLLIIKPDYMAKRKSLLLFLLQQGFFIKGQRKICFTPELAAEFYQDLSKDPCFMFQVILLSKGNSEAFILAKEDGVENLINVMVCYFGSSVEMEQNIHATKCLNKVQREITFIFPNYIYEPIFCTEQIKCTNNPLVGSTITALYDIITNPQRDPHKDWKEKLAESLVLTNEALPQVSNQCCYNSQLNMQETAQQTKITCFKPEEIEGNVFKGCSLSDMSLSKYCSSLNVTTSSCVSCSGFESGAECVKQTYQQSLEEIIKARTASLNIQEVSDNYTVKNEVDDDILEELSVEEDAAAEVDIANLMKAQFVYDDKSERVDTNNEYSTNKSSLIISLEPQLKENIPDVETYTDKEKLNEPALLITELLEVETPRLSNRENERSVENISTKLEEITHPYTELKKESIEEISPFPETVAIADENQQSVLNLPDRIEESADPIIEDASL